MQRQIKQLEGLSRVQQRFVSDVSHELRTPLTTIRMAADVMFEDRASFDAPTARAAELLQAQLDRFESLLVDLLEISRFDAGAAVLEADHVDVRELARRVIERAQPLAHRVGTDIRLSDVDPVDGDAAVAEAARPGSDEVRTDEDASFLVNGDARRIDRIVRNLVDNAIEHGNARGVDVEVGHNEYSVAVTVRDYGVGLRPGESSLVFNRFWRADPARARTTGGTGLGLSISLEDARLHGGWLEAWGEPGRGACFRLTLPRQVRGPIGESPLELGEAQPRGLTPYDRDARTRPEPLEPPERSEPDASTRDGFAASGIRQLGSGQQGSGQLGSGQQGSGQTSRLGLPDDPGYQRMPDRYDPAEWLVTDPDRNDAAETDR